MLNSIRKSYHCAYFSDSLLCVKVTHNDVVYYKNEFNPIDNASMFVDNALLLLFFSHM